LIQGEEAVGVIGVFVDEGVVVDVGTVLEE
jgi:hypothetical protein